jgi:hypothetical protein
MSDLSTGTAPTELDRNYGKISHSATSIFTVFDSPSSYLELSSTGGPGGGISNGDGGFSCCSLVDKMCWTQCFFSSVVDVDTD